MPSVAIIGAGPAGIYLTRFLKNVSCEVALFEQNKRIGEKLRITGGGRMNVTNTIFGKDQFTSSTDRLLDHLFRSPWVKQREQLLAKLGIKYIWEGNRAILASENAPAEVERFYTEMQSQANLSLHLQTKVQSIVKDESGYIVSSKHAEHTADHRFDIVVLSGGAMFRIFDLGTSEQIYQLPQMLDHTITDVAPSLSPIRLDPHPLKELSGVALKVTLKDIKAKRSCTDDVLITHRGISGPVCLDFSAMIASDHLEMCMMPQVPEEVFRNACNAARQGKVRLRHLLMEYIPKRLADWCIAYIEEEVTLNIADLSKKKLNTLLQLLFHYKLLNPQTSDYTSCWTTKGGVSLKQVNVSTLESKQHKGLFFAGEILDVNGLCGGYNISFAMISAKIVSEAIERDFCL